MSDMRKLVVVGGTAAGLSAAAKARRLDPTLEITVYEASGYVSYGSCGLPYFVGGLIGAPEDLLSLTAEELREKRKIPTYTHHRVLSVDREKRCVEVQDLHSGAVFRQPYDALILATGAVPIKPDIPGLDGPGVYFLRTVEDGIALKAAARSGAKRAVIIGGGFIGLEMAEQLTLSGLEVTVVEAMPRLLGMLPEPYARMVTDELSRHGVCVRTRTSAEDILRDERGAVTGVRLSDGGLLSAELVLLSVGVRPAGELAVGCGLTMGLKGGIAVDRGQRTSDPRIWACGDCVEMRHLITGKPCYFPLGTTANKQGRVAGENAAGGHGVFPGVLGSQVTKVFDLYIASTGLTQSQAEQAGLSARAATIVKNDRASYYPGGGENHLSLVFESGSGRLLGAQGVGTSTVAGRMNLLAAAITCGMDVRTLSELDLVYSPSVAPVYDPVLIAAGQAVKALER